MQIELSDIKRLRKQLGLSQTDLAKRANVSQSLIAKIEANRIDPTYSKVQKIFEALKGYTEKSEKTAGDIMNKGVISLNSDDSIKSAIKKMKKNNISQMPIIKEHTVVGSISDSVLIDALTEDKSPDIQVREIMKTPCPIVSRTASVMVVSNLLKHYSMVIVSEDGKIKGIITKADMLNNMYA
ncbi:CBS domain-containing protein [Nanoarchaeota archaeon]